LLDLDEFFANKEQYLRDYQARKRTIIDAAKASWNPEIDVLAELKRRIEPLLEESIYLAKGVGGPVRSTCSRTTTRPSSSPS